MIRPIEERDLQRVSALIQNTLLVSNLADYDLEIIGNLHNAFAPQQLRGLARKRRIFNTGASTSDLPGLTVHGSSVFPVRLAPLDG